MNHKLVKFAAENGIQSQIERILFAETAEFYVRLIQRRLGLSDTDFPVFREKYWYELLEVALEQFRCAVAHVGEFYIPGDGNIADALCTFELFPSAANKADYLIVEVM